MTKVSRKPKSKPIDANSYYEYEYSPDGERIKLCCMSHRERDRLLTSGMFVITKMLNDQTQVKLKLFESFQTGVEVEAKTSAELNEGFKPFHSEVCSLVEKIGIEDAAKVVSEWDDFGDFDVISKLVYRIIEVEQSLNVGDDIPAMTPYPTAEEIKKLSDKEAEALGESSQPSVNPSGTSPSDAQAEISSSGAESTTE